MAVTVESVIGTEGNDMAAGQQVRQAAFHDAARVEVVDMMHFLISAALVLGMTANDLFEAYTKKHRVNLDRQESGYTVKDESDNKHI